MMAGFGPPSSYAGGDSFMYRLSFQLAALLVPMWVALPGERDLFGEAVTALQRGDLAAAEQSLRTRLQSHPEDAPALGLLGVVLDSGKKYEEAAPYYRRALAITPRSPGLLNNYGNHLLASGDVPGARAVFQKVLAVNAAHPNANVQLAKLALDERQAATALRYLDSVQTSERDAPAAVLLRIRALYLGGRKTEAEAALSRFSDAAGNNPRANFSAGLALAAAERYDQAETFFSRALEATPGEFDILYNLGLAAFHAGHNERAQRVLEVARAQRPGDADVLSNLAAVNSSLGRKDAALALLAQASQLSPGRADIHQQLARTAVALGYYADAVPAWDKYIRLAPQDEAALRERAFAKSLGGDAASGVVELRRYVREHPKDAVGFYELGVAEAPADKEAAFVHEDRAVTLQPDFLPARFSRGVLHTELGRPETALPDLRFVLAREPNNAGVLDRLGMTYVALDRPQEAIPLLQKAAQLAPQDSKIHFHLSRALSHAGRYDEAFAAAAEFRRLGPAKRRPRAGIVDFLSLPAEEQKEQLRTRVQKRMESDPDNAALQLDGMKLLLADGNAAEGAAAARRLMALKPSAALLAGAGRALLEAGQYRLAKEVLEQAGSPEAALDLAIATFHAVSPQAGLEQMARIPEAQRSGDYYLARGDMLDSTGATDAAASDLERALRAYPERAALYHRAALFLIRHGRVATALELLDRGLRVLPADPSLTLLKATALELAHKTEAAERLLAQMESRWPEWSEPCAVYGIVLATHGRFEEARRRLETALALGADDAVVWYYLAKSTRQAAPGEVDSARKHVERALELAPQDPAVLALAGRIAFEQKQYDRAAERLQAAIRLGPQLVEAHADLAKTYAALGRHQDEQAELERVRVIRERNPSGEAEAAGVDALLPRQE